MAASEIAMAASQIATPAAQVPAVTGWTLVLSSAVVSALVNGVFKWWGERTARRDEKAKLAKQRAPARLDAALMLEAFAKQAVGYGDARAALIAELTRVHDPDHDDEPASEPVEWTPLTFDGSLAKEWTTLPIEIYSQCRELPLSLAESDKWTYDIAAQEWIDAADAYALDRQRAIFYGLLAGELANEIRSGIKVPASPLATDCFNRLQREFDTLKQTYVSMRGNVELIPDLKTRLQRECPEVPATIPPAPPPVRHTLD
ncbi:TPA: hypothetical protein U2L31_006545 [Burkholderia contaminans]|nr:hypothetical protein [Burkholderia contaminans]